MKALWKGKEALIRFYSAYDAYCTAVLKFAAAFLLLFAINNAFGNAGPLNQILLVVIAAAFCSFLPSNALVLLGAVFLEMQFWGTSLEAALAGAVVILIWLLLYFSFLPGQTYVVAAAALMLGIGFPFAVPVICGLLMGPGAIAGILMGTAAYYLSMDLGKSTSSVGQMGAEMLEQLLEQFRTILLNREMMISVVLLLAVFLVVYLIRRIPVSYSWQIGIVSGALVYGLLWGMKWLLLGEDVSLPYVAGDLVLGLLAGFLVQFFRFSLDYRNVQRLQFEDDDYYYYVKAVPKRSYKAEEQWLDDEDPLNDAEDMDIVRRIRKGEERE